MRQIFNADSWQEPWLILGDPKGASYVLQGKNYVRPDADRTVLELFVRTFYITWRYSLRLFSLEKVCLPQKVGWIPFPGKWAKWTFVGDEYRRMRKGLNPAFT